MQSGPEERFLQSGNPSREGPGRVKVMGRGETPFDLAGGFGVPVSF